jgi:hypothetical protein
MAADSIEIRGAEIPGESVLMQCFDKGSIVD